MTLLRRVRGLPAELRFLIAACVLSLDAAAEMGLLPVVRILIAQRTPSKQRVAAVIDTALAKAAKCGHLHVVQFLYQRDVVVSPAGVIERGGARGASPSPQFHKRQIITRYRSRAIDDAASNGHLHVVRYLLEAGGVCFSVAAIDRAAENGHDAVIDLLLQHEDKAIGGREAHGRAFTTLGIRWAERNHHTRIARRLQDELKCGAARERTLR